MDLLQTVRKEGSRGGRADFKWEDVKADQHRENYLGHSLMAPVGRWQKNKDLNWYAKSDGNGQPQSEADARKEEIRRVKEAEADALARALGYDVPVRPVEGNNANMTQLGERESKVIKESMEEDAGQGEGVKGIGFGGFAGVKGKVGDDEEIMEGANTGRGGLDKENGDRIRRDIVREERSRKTTQRDDSGRTRRRSRSRDGERRRHRHRHAGEEEHGRRHRERSRSRSRDRRRRSRSGDRRPREQQHHREERSGRDERRRSGDLDERSRRRSRSRSPYQRASRPIHMRD